MGTEPDPVSVWCIENVCKSNSKHGRDGHGAGSGVLKFRGEPDSESIFLTPCIFDYADFKFYLKHP